MEPASVGSAARNWAAASQTQLAANGAPVEPTCAADPIRGGSSIDGLGLSEEHVVTLRAAVVSDQETAGRGACRPRVSLDPPGHHHEESSSEVMGNP